MARRERFPRAATGLAVVAVCALLYALSGRYGYHRDELYFRMLPTQWGYVDQPFLTPLLVRGSTALFGDTLVGLRALAPLFVAAGMVLSALICREVGGSTRAQAFAAWGYGASAFPLISGHLMVTGTVDLALWMAILYAVTRALLADPRWWLAAGGLAGVALDDKLLVTMLVIALLVGLMVGGPRDVHVSPYLWGGGALALVLGAPTLIYQATHHWPQLEMARALHDDNATGVRAQLLPLQLGLLGPPMFAVAVAGFVAVWRRPGWHRLRALPVAYLVALLLNFAGGGQIYYALGLLAYLAAVGWVPVAERLRIGWPVAGIALNGAVSALIALPLLPISWAGVPGAINETLGDQVGWPRYVDELTGAYRGLPAAERARAVILTGNYGEAGAVARYGRGLPPVFSGHNELFLHGPPPDDRDVVVAWTEDWSALRRRFVDCRRLRTLDDRVGVDNEEQGSVVAVCRLPAGGWRAVWPELQHDS